MNLMGALNITDSVEDSVTSPELSGALGVAHAVINGIVYVYVSGSDDDGIQIFTLNGEGVLTPVDSFSDSNTIPLSSPAFMTIAEAGSNKYLIVPSEFEDGLTVFRIVGNGPNQGRLTVVDVELDGGPNALNSAQHAVSYEIGGKTFVAVTSYFSDSVSVFELRPNGNLALVEVIFDNDNPNFRLDSVEGIKIYEINGRKFAYVSSDDDGLSVFQIANDGTFNFRFDVPFASFNGEGLAVGEFNGVNYMLAADGLGDQIHVFELGSDGSPTFVSSYDTNTFSSDGFGESIEIEIVNIGGASFVITNGDASDSFVVMSIDPSGNLEVVQQIDDSSALNRATDVSYVEIDGRHFGLVTANFGDRLTVIELGGADDPVIGTNGDDRIVGLAGDDDLLGMSGNDEIFGNVGDDVLSGRGGNDTLNGGDGVDVLIGGVGRDLLIGGEAGDFMLGGQGNDELNYSGSNAAVTIDLSTGAASGGHAEGDIYFDIENITGSRFDDDLTGDSGDNDISAGNGNDTVDGGSGADDLEGGGGNDLLIGRAGNDTIIGGNGRDVLNGGADRDVLNGGGGNDEIEGGNGKDRINGGGGRDTIEGGRDDDTITGGGSDDVFVFDDNFGVDVISDFQNNGDLIDFSQHSEINSIGDLAIISIGSSTFLVFGSESIELANTNSNQIGASDFIF